ncbi:hypothetical protein ACJX0J_007639, partial [Zea mays]
VNTYFICLMYSRMFSTFEEALYLLGGEAAGVALSPHTCRGEEKWEQMMKGDQKEEKEEQIPTGSEITTQVLFPQAVWAISAAMYMEGNGEVQSPIMTHMPQSMDKAIVLAQIQQEIEDYYSLAFSSYNPIDLSKPNSTSFCDWQRKMLTFVDKGWVHAKREVSQEGSDKEELAVPSFFACIVVGVEDVFTLHIEKQVAELLSAGLIVRSICPFASPFVMVFLDDIFMKKRVFSKQNKHLPIYEEFLALILTVDRWRLFLQRVPF